MDKLDFSNLPVPAELKASYEEMYLVAFVKEQLPHVINWSQALAKLLGVSGGSAVNLLWKLEKTALISKEGNERPKLTPGGEQVYRRALACLPEYKKTFSNRTPVSGSIGCSVAYDPSLLSSGLCRKIHGFAVSSLITTSQVFNCHLVKSSQGEIIRSVALGNVDMGFILGHHEIQSHGAELLHLDDFGCGFFVSEMARIPDGVARRDCLHHLKFCTAKPNRGDDEAFRLHDIGMSYLAQRGIRAPTHYESEDATDGILFVKDAKDYSIVLPHFRTLKPYSLEGLKHVCDVDEPVREQGLSEHARFASREWPVHVVGPTHLVKKVSAMGKSGLDGYIELVNLIASSKGGVA